MGVLARRFLNLIVPGCTPGVKSLRRIDLTRHELFYPVGFESAPPPPAAAGAQDAISRPSALEMETVRFLGPSFTFRALKNDWKMDCFPLADYSECKVVCADLSGRGFVFDLDSPKVGTIPPLRTPKVMPISVFVHKPQVDGNYDNYSNGSSLFLMEKVPQPEARSGGGHVFYDSVQESEQFVGLINHRSTNPGSDKSWHCHRLPPPPFVHETIHWSNNNCPEITAYGVVGGGSHVCISVKGVGTYCLDTESHTWNKVGDWTLPFHGKVEYLPQLKLWFGLSTGARHCLAAADLSGMLDSSSQPQRLVAGPWQELVDLPEEWKECKDPQFVSLGSGRFCIARFFQEAAGSSDGVAHKNFTVLTGVEVNSRGKAEGGTWELELQMTTHRSRRVNDTSIEALF
ncbi:hypothetical protein BDA96_10G340300 [Sorghum bicolor]|jgi:hypothetical protein|uniref:Uncharacterized protein n=2 Tax=Sorghum bicolor TaxID=4558 RepID=A0A921Q8G8_SORBI|nr:uncharacterized protein LOC8064988 [Sorghum bicolor]XP_021306201.1 uncharacterized protein LOC8064988 [Sorghum bicolor]KAG0516184.1 hypothetical protein BDA96_10G340300 [Sorghum bicolor]KAG0516185.1 hypothetical protein BDA96_10G340300 [Sorghum bicolor]KXG20865.1 hypothetical protein SORBI_3010G263700 [Sorghum bicolor]KXG20866.1 hypothetical protein SORBI_3010G263700 [Sorghum bicolor]|eukprot:XP_021306200.1 uncharacterized protein LOC8064988 [Sorghum bicolor]